MKRMQLTMGYWTIHQLLYLLLLVSKSERTSTKKNPVRLLVGKRYTTAQPRDFFLLPTILPNSGRFHADDSQLRWSLRCLGPNAKIPIEMVAYFMHPSKIKTCEHRHGIIAVTI